MSGLALLSYFIGFWGEWLKKVVVPVRKGTILAIPRFSFIQIEIGLGKKNRNLYICGGFKRKVKKNKKKV